MRSEKVKLKDVANWGSGGTPSRKQKAYFSGDILWFKTGEAGPKYIWDSEEKITSKALSESSAKLYPAGSVVIAMYAGSTIGNCSILGFEAATNQAFAVAVCNQNRILNEYLYYFIMSQRGYLQSAAFGGTQDNLTLEKIQNWEIELPSCLDDQRAVVAFIEQHFEKIETGFSNLVDAERQLELYRQSVLKDAFEGKLTADWREANSDLVKPADRLLALIETESKAAHQAEIDAWKDAVNQWETNGRESKKPTKPRMVTIDHKQGIDFSSKGSPYLMCYLSSLGDFGRGKSKHRPRNDPHLYGGDYPFIQTGDVGNSLKNITEYSKTYNEFGLAQSKLWPAGTLCITIAANIAETAFLSFDACFPDSVVGFTMNRNLLNPDYVYYFFEHVQERLESYAPATAQKNINLQILNEVLIPFCCLHEQKVIVEKLVYYDQIIDTQRRSISDSLKKATALKQSILKQAFSGNQLLEYAS